MFQYSLYFTSLRWLILSEDHTNKSNNEITSSRHDPMSFMFSFWHVLSYPTTQYCCIKKFLNQNLYKKTYWNIQRKEESSFVLLAEVCLNVKFILFVGKNKATSKAKYYRLCDLQVVFCFCFCFLTFQGFSFEVLKCLIMTWLI